MTKVKHGIRTKLLRERRWVTGVTLLMVAWWSYYTFTAIPDNSPAYIFMVLLQVTTMTTLLIGRRFARIGGALMLLSAVVHTAIMAGAIQAQLAGTIAPVWIPFVSALVLTLPYLTSGFAFTSIAHRLRRTKRDDNLDTDQDDHTARLALDEDAEFADLRVADEKQQQRRFATA